MADKKAPKTSTKPKPGTKKPKEKPGRGQKGQRSGKRGS